MRLVDAGLASGSESQSQQREQDGQRPPPADRVDVAPAGRFQRRRRMQICDYIIAKQMKVSPN